MEKKSVLFSIEIADRELVSKVLLSLQCAKRGMRAYVGSYDVMSMLGSKIKSCIFFHKSLSDRAKLYTHKYGADFCYLDEEAGLAIPKTRIEEFLRFRLQGLSNECVKDTFVVGKTYEEATQTIDFFEGINVNRSGWPRIDLWRPEFRHLYDEQVEGIRKKHGSFYLFISSFGATSKRLFDKAIAATDDEFVRTTRKLKCEALFEHMDLIKEMSCELEPHEKIIIRPHPSEYIEDWKKFSDQLDNVEVVRDGDVTPWILASASILHFNSTVGLQAALHGRKTVIYKHEPVPGIFDTVLNELSHNADNYSDVLEFLRINSNKSSDEVCVKAIDLIQSEVASLSGQLASEKIAQVLVEKDVRLAPKISFSRLDRAKIFFEFLFRVLKFKAKKIIREVPLERSPFEKIPNGITATEIYEHAQMLSSVLDIDLSQVRVEQVCKDLVSIEIQ